jgi:hypothetical protein
MNMDNKKYDDLDKLFRSRLKNEEILDQNWNKPPQSVFDGAISVLDKEERKRRRRLLWWIIPVVILLGFTALTINQLNKINHLENTIAALQSSDDLRSENPRSTAELTPAQSITEQKNTEISNIQNSKNKKAEKQKQINSNQSSPQKTSSKNSLSKQRMNSTISATNTKRDEVKAARATKQVEAVNPGEEALDSDPQLLSADLIRKDRNTDPLPGSILVIEGSAKEFPSYGVEILQKKQEQSCQPKTFQFYALGGVNASTIKMTNIGNPDFRLTGYERYYADWFTGLGFEYSFHPKWSLLLEASYNRMHVQSTYEHDIVYDKSLEYIDNQGNVNYESNYEVATVMGRQSSAFSIDLGEKNIADHAELQNLALIDNSFSTLSLGLGTQYQLFCHKNWSLDMGVGLQYNYLLQLNEQMESSIYHENGLMFRESIVVEPMDKANQSFWSLSGNMRLGYQFNDLVGIKLNMGSTHSLHFDPEKHFRSGS